LIEQLKDRCEPGEGMHFGFSGWLNFDIIAATKPKGAIICDINPRMIAFYKLFGEILLKSSDRHEFVQILRIKLDERIDYFENGWLFQLESETERPEGWLFSEEKFNFLKELHKDGKIQFNMMDAVDGLEVYEALSKKSGPFTTVYGSNIYEWLMNGARGSKQSFKSNMRSLLSADTLYVDAFYPTRRKDGTGPPLRITQADLPDFVVARR
jgi:hypothetical protein